MGLRTIDGAAAIMDQKADIQKNLSAILQRIAEAARGCGRNPESVRLVTVAKTQPVALVRTAIDAGAGIFHSESAICVLPAASLFPAGKLLCNYMCRQRD